jgi:hypothetical protein
VEAPPPATATLPPAGPRTRAAAADAALALPSLPALSTPPPLKPPVPSSPPPAPTVLAVTASPLAARASLLPPLSGPWRRSCHYRPWLSAEAAPPLPRPPLPGSCSRPVQYTMALLDCGGHSALRSSRRLANTVGASPSLARSCATLACPAGRPLASSCFEYAEDAPSVSRAPFAVLRRRGDVGRIPPARRKCRSPTARSSNSSHVTFRRPKSGLLAAVLCTTAHRS